MMMEILDCSDIGLRRQVEGGLEARLRKKYSHSSNKEKSFQHVLKRKQLYYPINGNDQGWEMKMRKNGEI